MNENSGKALHITSSQHFCKLFNAYTLRRSIIFFSSAHGAKSWIFVVEYEINSHIKPMQRPSLIKTKEIGKNICKHTKTLQVDNIFQIVQRTSGWYPARSSFIGFRRECTIRDTLLGNSYQCLLQ